MDFKPRAKESLIETHVLDKEGRELKRKGKAPGNPAPGDRLFEKALIFDLKNLKTIGRYRIKRLLGQGSAGLVFLGKDPYIRRYVALKLSRPTSENSRKSFFIEAQAAGALNHPHIVAIYDFDVFGEYCYLAMEYVEGATIEQFCRRDSLLSLSRVTEIIFSVCNALSYAHSRGVVHLDIKPSNILLDQTGAVKLTDFGIAQRGEQRGKKTVFGTPCYMSPERLTGGMIGIQSDIFSLGCVLYELLTGEKAFKGRSLDEITDNVITAHPASIRSLRPGLPESLEEICRKALTKEPLDRYQTCADMAYYLRLALKNLTGTVREPKDFYEYVQNVPFFQFFTKEQVRELVKTSRLVQAARGEIIFKEGEVDDTFYIILSGKVRVKKEGHCIAVIEAGDCFGEMSVIGQQARTATVEAATDCALMKISATLLNRSPESVQLLFFQRFATTLVNRLSKSSVKGD